MRRIVAVAFLLLVADRADAFCIFNCPPSEANARSAFESLLKNQFSGSSFRIVTFEKTNGVERQVFGQKIYELSYKALVELPNGANHECKSDKNFNWGNFHKSSMCAANGRKYWPPGQKLNYSETFLFEKTERGWMGPDGALY